MLLSMGSVQSLRAVEFLTKLLNRGPDSLNRVFANKRNWALAVCLVMSLQTFLIFDHTPWLDEWQALQISIQSPTIPDLLENLRYEGHPPLWYLLLRATSKFVGPFLALPTLAFVLALMTQSAILFTSPFSRAERILLGTGCFILFEFLTISRSLTLGVAMLFVSIASWRSRWMWLPIALLPMCDFLFGAISVILLVILWRERRLWWPGLAAWLVSAAISAWAVSPNSDTIPALERNGILLDLFNYVQNAGLLLLPLQWGKSGPTWNGNIPFGLGVFFGLLFFLFAATQLRGERVIKLLFWSFVLLTLVFSLAIYPLPSRHLMLIALLLIVMVWRRASLGVPPTAGFRAWLVVGSGCGLFVAAWSCIIPFDTAAAAARQIRQRGLADKHWMVFPDSRALGVSALTGISFERTETRCMQSFIRWNYRTQIRKPAQLAGYLRHESATRGRFYLLSDLPLSDLLWADVLRPIAHIPAGYDGFDYYLFVVGQGRQDIRTQQPMCVSKQQPLF